MQPIMHVTNKLLSGANAVRGVSSHVQMSIVNFRCPDITPVLLPELLPIEQSSAFEILTLGVGHHPVPGRRSCLSCSIQATWMCGNGQAKYWAERDSVMEAPSNATHIYMMAFWLVVDFGVPFVLGLAHAGWWTPVLWSFIKGIYVGWAKWSPPGMALRDKFARQRYRAVRRQTRVPIRLGSTTRVLIEHAVVLRALRGRLLHRAIVP